VTDQLTRPSLTNLVSATDDRLLGSKLGFEDALR
jgi:hypothetical protein